MDPAPFSRPYSVRHVGQAGADVTVEANEAEREVLAAELGLGAIAGLVGRFRLEGRPDRVSVTGRVEADVAQICVVTLDPFPVRVEEEVALTFRERSDREVRGADPSGGEVETDLDAADELVDGRIDLGAIAAEFLALALDPYPRKPGAELERGGEEAGGASPFGVLAGLGTRDA